MDLLVQAGATLSGLDSHFAAVDLQIAVNTGDRMLIGLWHRVGVGSPLSEAAMLDSQI